MNKFTLGFVISTLMPVISATGGIHLSGELPLWERVNPEFVESARRELGDPAYMPLNPERIGRLPIGSLLNAYGNGALVSLKISLSKNGAGLQVALDGQHIEMVNGIGYEFSLTKVEGRYLIRYDEATKLGKKRHVLLSLDVVPKGGAFEFNMRQLE